MIRLVGVLSVLSIAGCFSPDFQDVECGPNGECPPGHTCNTTTGICEKGDDPVPSIDAAVNAPDADPDMPDATPGQRDAIPIGDPDAGPACDLSPQDGCGGTSRCTVIGSGIEADPFVVSEAEVACTDGNNGQGFGEPCSWSVTEQTAHDNCAPGLLCDGNPGDCRPFCDFGDDGATCVLKGGSCIKPEGGTLDDTAFGVCIPGG